MGGAIIVSIKLKVLSLTPIKYKMAGIETQ
jgi:hypothetical protein